MKTYKCKKCKDEFQCRNLENFTYCEECDKNE